MNWSRSIVLAFVLFAILIFSLVVISMNQEVNLVSGDYYKQEIEYQNQIERIKNAKNLDQKPVFSLENNMLVVRFDSVSNGTFKEGKVQLYSNISSNEDRVYSLGAKNYPAYQFDVSALRKGNWIIKLSWKDEIKEYYLETNLQL